MPQGYLFFLIIRDFIVTLIDHTRVPYTVALADEVVLESAVCTTFTCGVIQHGAVQLHQAKSSLGANMYMYSMHDHVNCILSIF